MAGLEVAKLDAGVFGADEPPHAASDGGDHAADLPVASLVQHHFAALGVGPDVVGACGSVFKPDAAAQRGGFGGCERSSF